MVRSRRRMRLRTMLLLLRWPLLLARLLLAADTTGGSSRDGGLRCRRSLGTGVAVPAAFLLLMLLLLRHRLVLQRRPKSSKTGDLRLRSPDSGEILEAG